MSGENDGCLLVSLEIITRRNFRLTLRNHRRSIILVAIACAVGLLVYAGLAFGEEYNARLDAQLALSTHVADRMYVNSLGAPGFVHSDLTELTADLANLKLSPPITKE